MPKKKKVNKLAQWWKSLPQELRPVLIGTSGLLFFLLINVLFPEVDFDGVIASIITVLGSVLVALMKDDVIKE